jgi:hypothetical protein
MTIEELAVVVMSNYRNLQEGEIIARIMILTGRPYTRAFKGYNLMVEKKLFPEGYIKAAGVWNNFHTKNPHFGELMDRFDCVPGKSSTYEFDGFHQPKLITREEAIKQLSISKPEF